MYTQVTTLYICNLTSCNSLILNVNTNHEWQLVKFQKRGRGNFHFIFCIFFFFLYSIITNFIYLQLVWAKYQFRKTVSHDFRYCPRVMNSMTLVLTLHNILRVYGYRLFFFYTNPIRIIRFDIIKVFPTIKIVQLSSYQNFKSFLLARLKCLRLNNKSTETANAGAVANI